jgi:hypothetical protein
MVVLLNMKRLGDTGWFYRPFLMAMQMPKLTIMAAENAGSTPGGRGRVWN